MKDPNFLEMNTYERKHHLARLAEILKAAGHPVRLEIIHLLQGEAVSVGALIDGV